MAISLADLRTRGWETKAGMLHAPTRDGKLTRMWGEEVIDGPLPRTFDARLHYRMARASIEPVYQKAWTHWMQEAVSRRDHKMGFAVLSTEEQKALSEGTDTAGGVAVPVELAASIISVVGERSIVRQNALVIPTVRDNLVLSVWDFPAEWVGEVPATTDTTVTPLEVLSIPIKKVRAKVSVSDDLLDDQPSFLAWFTRAAGDQLSLAEDKAYIGGNGISQPLGMIYAVDTGDLTNSFDITGTTAHTISNTAVAVGSVPKMITMEASLMEAFRRRSHWFCAGATLAEIRNLVDGQSRNMFPSYVGPDGDDMLMSHPIHTSTSMPLDGVAGARPLLLADLTSYIVATRALLTVRVDSETLGDVDKVMVYIFDRIGGQIATPDAVRIGSVS